MPQVRIVTDSISDIPPDITQELKIEVVPTLIIINGQTYRDKVDLSDAEFYKLLMESDKPPSTSQPPIGDFEAVYQRLAQETEQIISIHIPDTVSGTLDAARAAAADMVGTDIIVIDSRQISMAQGWLAILAARVAQAGHPLDEILDLIEKTIPRLHLVAVLETLEYARRGGRIGRAAAMMGTVLRVKPLIAFQDGQLMPLENARTMHRAIDRLIQMVREWAPLEEAAVIHAAAPELATQIQSRLGDFHPIEQIPVTEAGPTLGAHAGPGAVGIACVKREDRYVVDVRKT